MRRILVGSLALFAGLLSWSLVGLAVQGVPATAARPPAQEDPGIISGVVLDAATKQPIGGAVVSLQPARGGGTARSQITDARGRFILTGIQTGATYSVNASKPGYFTTPFASARQLSVAAGQWIADVRVELSREGSIAGTVVDERGEPMVGARVRVLAQLTIAGRANLASGLVVRTDDRGVFRIPGLPQGRYLVSVPSVQNAVPADTPATIVAGMAPAAVANAAAAGRALPAEPPAITLAAGQRLVVGNYVTLPPLDAAGRPQAYPITFYPNALSIAEASVIALAAGQQREGIDFQLRPVRTWSVSGQVDGSAALVSGLTLRLMPAGAEDLGIGSEAATTLVMSDGRFVFPSVPAGRYTIDARSSITEIQYRPQGLVSASDALPRTPGFVSSRGGGGTIAGAPEGANYSYSIGERDATLWGRAEVDVSGRDMTNVIVTMRRAVKITGRVQIEGASNLPEPVPAGRVGLPAAPSRAGGAPGIGRGVVMAEPANGSASLGILSGTIAADNTFTVDGLMPGPYALRVLGIGLGGGGPMSLKSIVAGNTDHTYVPFDASRGSDISNVVVTFIEKTQSIAGSVTNLPAGTSATVFAFPADRERWTNFGFQPLALRSAPASSSGSYQVTLPAGDYLLVATDRSRAADWQNLAFLEVASRAATRVTLDWGEPKTQDLRFVEIAR